MSYFLASVDELKKFFGWLAKEHPDTAPKLAVDIATDPRNADVECFFREFKFTRGALVSVNVSWREGFETFNHCWLDGFITNVHEHRGVPLYDVTITEAGKRKAIKNVSIGDIQPRRGATKKRKYHPGDEVEAIDAPNVGWWNATISKVLPNKRGCVVKWAGEYEGCPSKKTVTLDEIRTKI
jgi:hypothetical protein